MKNDHAWSGSEIRQSHTISKNEDHHLNLGDNEPQHSAQTLDK